MQQDLLEVEVINITNINRTSTRTMLRTYPALSISSLLMNTLCNLCNEGLRTVIKTFFISLRGRNMHTKATKEHNSITKRGAKCSPASNLIGIGFL